MNVETDEIHVFLAEDGTAIKQEVDFHIKTQRVVGLQAEFDRETGMPKVESFVVGSVTAIDNIMKKHKENLSKLLYLVVLITLAKGVPPFIFALFGTTNSFTAQNCITR